MSNDYHGDVKKEKILRVRKYLDELPPFAVDFFRSIADSTSSRTQVAYAHDLTIFFSFLVEEVALFSHKKVTDLDLEDLNQITLSDLEAFSEYLNYYIKEVDGVKREYTNEALGKYRKLSAVRRLFSHFYRREKLAANPAELINMPKIRDKEIIRLEPNEVAKLLDIIESGEPFTGRQKALHERTKKRDLAIVTLLLGTGIRLSECVGLNISHLNFDVNGIKIIRKGGNETVVYFGEEVRDALLDYLDERKEMEVKEGHEDALFISLHKRRITDRAIQNLVKKYSQLVTNLKNISPHKLRSTFGTNLYRESGDIYLVAEALGHKDVNTTKTYYAAADDDKRRQAVKYIKLRDD